MNVKLPMDPRVMLLLDFNHWGVMIWVRELLANMLTAATLLIAKHWKAQEELTTTDWTEEVKYMCLVNKLTASIRVRKGKSDGFERICS